MRDGLERLDSFGCCWFSIFDCNFYQLVRKLSSVMYAHFSSGFLLFSRETKNIINLMECR